MLIESVDGIESIKAASGEWKMLDRWQRITSVIGERELKDEAFFNKIIHANIPVLLLLNKIDNSNQEQLEEQVAFWTEKVPNGEIFPISALKNFNVPEVFARILALLPVM